MRIIAKLAAALAVALVTAGTANAQTLTCQGADVLAEYKGEPRCFTADNVPPDAIVIVTEPETSAPDETYGDGEPSVTLEEWAVALEDCFAENNAFSPEPGIPGCFAGLDGRAHCTGPGYGKLVKTCSDVANAAGRPARWNGS